MVGMILVLCSLLVAASFVETIMVLSLLVPGAMIYLYKTNMYIEDLFFCMNDLNSMLMFMTMSLALLIYLSSGHFTWDFYTMVTFSLVVVLVLCFMSSNLLWFYILFEMSLLPILLMIIGWGYQPERLQAGVYMIMYTVFGSMPLLLLILYYGAYYGTFNLYVLFMLINNIPHWCVFFGFLAFLVKLPIWSLHVWLPKAHVEAPLGGSMILAGVLLKLGGYGLYVYSMLCISPMNSSSPLFIISLSLWGGVCASLLCLSQSDIKAMIAYSSIVHMSLVVLGVMSNTTWGMMCALLTMVAHGWVSSALFLLAYISYEKVGSRSFNYTKGLLTLYPILSYLWFIVAMVNMAVPPTINLVGELVAVPVALWLSMVLVIVLLSVMFMSVTYNMYLYIKINHGAPSGLMSSSSGPSSRGFLTILGHLLPLLLIFSLDLMSSYTESCM
uniref:NADH-ubiquinone oxidoreductase chain 4 n=1 Tax=Mastigeulota kiangsinensis TaxID=1544384 RepID=A0A0U1V694_MASKI|nr:NADH dehydrogenase subunit 4 [Mastigeulota kiangsinensis]AIN75498.1 NADH dehydrogenase subunit 4 [Mastigeulota kiangsinensis]